MAGREKVIEGLKRCIDTHSGCGKSCPYFYDDCGRQLKRDALDLLKEQEPHIITKDDFNNNPSVDENGYLPAYCEKIDRPIGWMAIHKGYIGARKDIRYWTGKPTEEQREAVKWE